MGCYVLLQGSFLTQGSNPGLLHCRWILYHLSHQGNPYINIHPLFFGFPSHLGHHRSLSRVPCAIRKVLISYLFYTWQCCMCQSQSPVSSHIGIHMFVLYVCVSISALQIGSPVSFCQIPYPCTKIRYLCFSFWLPLLCLTVSRSLQFSFAMHGCKRHRSLMKLDLHTSQKKVHKEAPKQASLVVQR